MFRSWARTRLTAAGVVLALVPFSLVVPGLAAGSVLAGVVVALNVVEHAIVSGAANAGVQVLDGVAII